MAEGVSVARLTEAALAKVTTLGQLCESRERWGQANYDAWQDSVAKVGALEVQLSDLKRQLVTAMEQARAAEKKANRLGHELERARATKP